MFVEWMDGQMDDGGKEGFLQSKDANPKSYTCG